MEGLDRQVGALPIMMDTFIFSDNKLHTSTTPDARIVDGARVKLAQCEDQILSCFSQLGSFFLF